VIADVLSLFALLVLAAFGVAAGSVVVWALFQASIKLWQLPGDRRRVRAINRRQALRLPATTAMTDDEKLSQWYAEGRLTWTELDLLAEFVVWQGRSLPKTAAQATAMLWSDFERHLAPTRPADAASVDPATFRALKDPLPSPFEPATGAAAVPDLPPHYFDGRVSADPPEDPTGWVEWARPGKASIWIRRSS
jgi:hypothetical protein